MSFPEPLIYLQLLIAILRTQPLPSNVVSTHNTYQGNCALRQETQPGMQGGWGHTSVGMDKRASIVCTTGADSWVRTQPLLSPESPSSSPESSGHQPSACFPPLTENRGAWPPWALLWCSLKTQAGLGHRSLCSVSSLDCPLSISFLCQVLLAFVDLDTWAGTHNDAMSLNLDPGLKRKTCLKTSLITKQTHSSTRQRDLLLFHTGLVCAVPPMLIK